MRFLPPGNNFDEVFAEVACFVHWQSGCRRGSGCRNRRRNAICIAAGCSIVALLGSQRAKDMSPENWATCPAVLVACVRCCAYAKRASANHVASPRNLRRLPGLGACFAGESSRQGSRAILPVVCEASCRSRARALITGSASAQYAAGAVIASPVRHARPAKWRWTRRGASLPRKKPPIQDRSVFFKCQRHVVARSHVIRTEATCERGSSTVLQVWEQGM